jgi:hypothetical protein
VARDETGSPASPADGGVFPEKSPITTVKFPGEARGLFGCAVRREADGSLVGVKAVPFQYTGRTVVGFKTFEQYLRTELNRVKPLRSIWGAVGHGYPERYGPGYEVQLRAEVNKKYCCIKELIDHAIEQSTAIYANTVHANTFFIFHDALSTWWENEAQVYIAQLGFANRQVRCMGTTNAGTRYEGKLTGDSPEMCRGLDSHGFADLVSSMQLHCSLSSLYEVGDPRRFNLGTPEEVWSTMSRCWLMEPTSERIVQDVSKFRAVLDIIIAAQGCVVQDIFFRSGRRGDEWMRAKGDGHCKNKPRPRQRKATLKTRPIHPDARHAYNQLTTNAGANMEADLQGLMAEILLGMQQNFAAANNQHGEENDGVYHDHVN